MQKIFWVFFLAVVFSFLTFSAIGAANCPKRTCDESAKGANGLVPCGRAPIVYDANGCPTSGCPCTADHIFTLANNIYTFAVKNIIGPVVTIMLIVGAILYMAGGASPALATFGKKAMWTAVIGGVLAYGSLAIINFILSIFGLKQISP